MLKEEEFDWWSERVTNEIYLSTHRADWWKFCGIVAELLAPQENMIDVGTGDGHTLWQIVSHASTMDTFRIKRIDLLEPSGAGLHCAVRRCCELPTFSFSAYQARFDQFVDYQRRHVETGQIPRQYDALFASHVNYYLGAADTVQGRGRYFAALDAMTDLARTVILVTAPRESDYYKMVSNPFGNYVYSAVVAAHYRSRGFQVEVTGTTMRFYVEHVNQSRHEAVVLWKFFNNTERQPTNAELSAFITNANRVKDGDGNINFRDDILVVTAQ